MNSKLPAVAMICCTLSYAMAGTSAIGTASARGDMRVDGYAVKGDATLFNGTLVETGQNSAALRLDKGVEVRLATDTQGTLYRDHLVLQHGSTEVKTSSPFQVEANGLRVTAAQPNSTGTVSVGEENTVEVAALTGAFRVTNSRGFVLAKIQPGSAMSFGASQATPVRSATPVQMTLFGDLTHVDGHYYLNLPIPDLGIVYELTGGNLDSMVGKRITITGVVDFNGKPTGKSSYVIDVATVKEVPPPEENSHKKKVVAAVFIGAGAAGLALGLYAVNHNPGPASR
jgi:hypothetical protein